MFSGSLSKPICNNCTLNIWKHTHLVLAKPNQTVHRIYMSVIFCLTATGIGAQPPAATTSSHQYLFAFHHQQPPPPVLPTSGWNHYDLAATDVAAAVSKGKSGDCILSSSVQHRTAFTEKTRDCTTPLACGLPNGYECGVKYISLTYT